MVFQNIFKKPIREDEYVEFEPEEENELKKVSIEVEKLEDYSDAERIQNKVREGSVLLVKIRDLRLKDMKELKRAITRLRKTCLAVDGDITGVGQDWMIASPKNFVVRREGDTV